MKRIILLAAFGAAGLVSANTSEMKEVKGTLEKVPNIQIKTVSKAKSSYYPITMTSSCGYTQTVEVGPNDQPDCWITDLNQMEEDCASPFENPQLGMG